MKKQGILEMIVERTRTGYSAYAKNYPVFTVGVSMKELKKNMHEALNLYFAGKRRKVRRGKHKNNQKGFISFPRLEPSR
jgi:hypothetical protein